MVARACHCGGRIDGRPPVCDRCGPVVKASNAAPVLSDAEARIYHNDSRWRRESERFKAQYPFCCVCILTGRVNGDRGRRGLLVDHIVPAVMLPGMTRGEAFWDKSNWQVICLDCDLRHKKPIEKQYTNDPIGLQVAWSALLHSLRVSAAEELRDVIWNE